MTSDHHSDPPGTGRLAGLTLLALGIVYGDIGTSPLYALRECFGGAHPVLRADNRGEGGILALMALVRHAVQGHSLKVFVALGLFGAALLYGDGTECRWSCKRTPLW